MKHTSHILVAEHDLASISLMEKVLHENNVDFDIVSTVAELDEMLDKQKYDLLIFSNIPLTDAKSNMNTLLQKIQEQELPVLMLLSKQSKKFRLIGFKQFEYLEKPLSAKSFLTKVKSLLQL